MFELNFDVTGKLKIFFLFLGDGVVNSTAPLGRPLLDIEDVVIGTTFSNAMNIRQSPPKAVVDSSPLQPAMDKNKECKCCLYCKNFLYTKNLLVFFVKCPH